MTWVRGIDDSRGDHCWCPDCDDIIWRRLSCDLYYILPDSGSWYTFGSLSPIVTWLDLSGYGPCCSLVNSWRPNRRTQHNRKTSSPLGLIFVPWSSPYLWSPALVFNFHSIRPPRRWSSLQPLSAAPVSCPPPLSRLSIKSRSGPCRIPIILVHLHCPLPSSAVTVLWLVRHTPFRFYS